MCVQLRVLLTNVIFGRESDDKVSSCSSTGWEEDAMEERHGFLFTKKKYLVVGVEGWRNNISLGTTEFLVRWSDRSSLWQPLAGGGNYARHIMEFLRTVDGPPPEVQEPSPPGSPAQLPVPDSPDSPAESKGGIGEKRPRAGDRSRGMGGCG